MWGTTESSARDGEPRAKGTVLNRPTKAEAPGLRDEG